MEPSYFDCDLIAQLIAQDYYPGGIVMQGRSFSSVNYRFGFDGQEKDDEIKGSGNSYTAEFWEYDPRLVRRWNIDPAIAQKPWISSYHAFSNKLIWNIDPNGANDNPVYDTEGSLLGTDDKGIQGDALFMNKDDFQQGMSHDEAVAKDKEVGGVSSLKGDPKAISYYLSSWSFLPRRPDWDGVVTREEGIVWAKTHPKLDDNENPQDGYGNAKPSDYLYLDASKMNFGSLHKEIFEAIGVRQRVNLLDYVDLSNDASVNTTYALGRTRITLVNAEGTVSISNGPWNSFNWDYGGGFSRDAKIWMERTINDLKDSHGFPLLIYGQGKLNTP
ncbi:MAG: hypothetical protein ABI729_10370 [Chitinophagales bacterium]